MSWSIKDITIEEHEDKASISETADLETRHYVGDQPFFSIMTCLLTVVIDTSQNPAKIIEMHFDPIPPDESNPPDVRLILKVPPDGAVLQDQGYLEYRIGVKNLGGSGYYIVLERIEHPIGTGVGYMVPAWINANETEESQSYSLTTISVGETGKDTVILEITVLSGTSLLPITL